MRIRFLPAAALAALLTMVVGLVAPADAAGRRALVVGNADYTATAPLPDAIRDADEIAAALRTLGFAVDERRNLSFANFSDALVDYYRAGSEADVSVFFYAGHAISIDGQNYLLPVDFDAKTPTEAKFRALEAQLVVQTLADTSKTALIFLDSSRDNAWAKRFREQGAGSRGLAAMSPRAAGTMISFAAEPGRLARDGAGRSPYAKALLELLPAQDLTLSGMMARLRVRVRDLTGAAQVPWMRSSLAGEFRFRAKAKKPATASAPRFQAELGAWRSAQSINTAEGFARFLAEYPDSVFAPLAKAAIAARAPAPDPTPEAAPAPAQQVAAGPSIAERELWEAARQLNTLAGYDRYVRRYPDGAFSLAADVRREILLAEADRRRAESAAARAPAASSTLLVIESAQPTAIRTIPPTGEPAQPVQAPTVRDPATDDAQTDAARKRARAQQEAARLAALSAERERARLLEGAEARALARIHEAPLEEFQWALKGLGYYNARVDGRTGPGTKRAIRAFQRQIGGAATGKLSDAQALQLIEMAAAQGYAASQNTLGILYATGIGHAEDPVKSKLWLERAARQGHKGAQANLRRIASGSQ